MYPSGSVNGDGVVNGLITRPTLTLLSFALESFRVQVPARPSGIRHLLLTAAQARCRNSQIFVLQQLLMPGFDTNSYVRD